MQEMPQSASQALKAVQTASHIARDLLYTFQMWTDDEASRRDLRYSHHKQVHMDNITREADMLQIIEALRAAAEALQVKAGNTSKQPSGV